MLVKKKIVQILLAAFMLSCTAENNKIGVVDLQILYQSFDYQKELALEYEVIKSNYSTYEDSLKRTIQLVEINIKNSSEHTDSEKNILFERAYVDYLDATEYLEFQKDSIGDDYSAKIWKQLNSYLKTYGDENNFDLIIGMQGNGTVMYVKDAIEISEEVTEYVNQKYNGE